jgi:hypothetical protein
MNHHVSSVHEENKPLKCKICDAPFTRKCGLKIHIANIHGGNWNEILEFSMHSDHVFWLINKKSRLIYQFF